MKILASVYACSPYDGSERAVGWNWIKELNKHHHITALTCQVYKDDIEKYIKENPNEMLNTKFVYIDVPHTAWHVGYKLERFYYILWQKQALKIAKKITAKENFDLVHHITYVTCVLPTYLYKLKIPFLYGPVAGGVNAPKIPGFKMDKKILLIEKTRVIVQSIFCSLPNFRKAIKKSALVLTTTEETKVIIPKKFHNKVEIFQTIGLNQETFYPEPKQKTNRKPKFLMAGRMHQNKAFEIGILAFIKAIERGFDGELVILGDTENNPSYEAYNCYLKKLSKNHLDKEIKFVPKVDYSKMKEFYDEFDVLINCSLRDSGCFVVMEAMSRALPVIVVDTGGPKINTTNDTSIKIKPSTMDQMVNEIADAIEELGNNKAKREIMGKKAREYALNTFLLERKAEQMNIYYSKVVKNQTN